MKQMDQHFHICLWSGPRGLNPPPPYGGYQGHHGRDGHHGRYDRHGHDHRGA